MKQAGDMKFYSLDEIEDEIIGAKGTPERDRYERELQEELNACRLGEAIRKARISQNLTQEQLGEKIGVQKAQISRLEKGRSITVATMSRVFGALGGEVRDARPGRHGPGDPLVRRGSKRS